LKEKKNPIEKKKKKMQFLDPRNLKHSLEEYVWN